jgi:hypothetical protein
MLSGDNDAVSRYSQVTDPGRFRVLHTAAEGLLASAQCCVRGATARGCHRPAAQRDVSVVRPHGADRAGRPGTAAHQLGVGLASPIQGRFAEAAPVTIHFSDFPGVRTRYGSWVTQSRPVCGCDACDDDPAALAEDLVSEVERVAAGCLEERLRRWPRPSLAWCLRERMTDANRFARRSRTSRSSWGRLSRDEVRELQRHRDRGRRDWQPWPSRG